MKRFYFLCALLVTLIVISINVFAQDKQADNTITEGTMLEGQVVCCADCWAEKDRLKFEFGNAEDLLTAKGCVEGGDPTLLAVKSGVKFTLYQLEEGKFRLPGKNWLEYVGKYVVVNGTTRKEKKRIVFRVDTLEITKDSLAAREAQEAIGKTVELKLKDLFGADQNLDQFKGRIVILNFWATFCIPCREEMPDLAEIQNEYAAFGVQVIGASSDASEDRPKVLKFIKETKINFPVWLGATAEDMTRFGLGEALPGTAVIDKDGKIVEVISGVVDPAVLKNKLDMMLGAQESAVPKEVSKVNTTLENLNPKKPENNRASSVPS